MQDVIVSDVTLLNEDNSKLSEQLKSAFKQTINSNKYRTKEIIQAPHQILEKKPIKKKRTQFIFYLTIHISKKTLSG